MLIKYICKVVFDPSEFGSPWEKCSKVNSLFLGPWSYIPPHFIEICQHDFKISCYIRLTIGFENNCPGKAQVSFSLCYVSTCLLHNIPFRETNFSHVVQILQTVSPSFWQPRCCFIPTNLFRSTFWFSSQECIAHLRAKRVWGHPVTCLKISDCLFLNPLLMRIKAKNSMEASSLHKAKPKHSEDQGAFRNIHENPWKQTMWVLYIDKLCTFQSLCVDFVPTE